MVSVDVLERARAWIRDGARSAPDPIPPIHIAQVSPGALVSPDPVTIAAILCRKFEGLYLGPYLCPAGVPTIGYGSTYYPDGRRVTLKDRSITRAEAEAMLMWMLKTVYLPAVILLCPNVKHPGRIAGLIDFTFNLGGSRLKTSTLRRRVNDERWEDVPDEYRKWVMGGGKKLRGLVLRREADIQVSEGKYELK